MTRYEFDKESFSFRKAGQSVGSVLWRVVEWLIASFSLAALYYVVIALLVSTDTERKLLRENRQYEKAWEGLQEKQRLVSDNVTGLTQRDDAIYGEIFHTRAPRLDPAGSLTLLSGEDPAAEGNTVAATAVKAGQLRAAAASVERNFLAISASMAARKGKIPPMHVPVDHLTYAQTGAGTGLRLSPFYKVPVQHNGLDLVGGQGEPVYAAAAGTVSEVTHSGKGLGNVVEIDHGNGYVTRYGHLADITVSKGQRVSRGKKIAEIGISGNSFAPHLHFEVLHDGQPSAPENHFFATLDPEDYARVAYMASNTEQSLD